MNSSVAHRFAHPVASVTIVGAGLVGTTTAHALLVSGTASEIVLVGRCEFSFIVSNFPLRMS